MNKRNQVITVVSVVSFLLLGCELDEPCDEGYTYDEGACYPPAEPSAGGAPSSGGSSGSGDEPNFFDPCTEAEDCRGGTTCDTFMSNSCIGFCGTGDPFEDNCPDGTTCQEFTGVFVCAP